MTNLLDMDLKLLKIRMLSEKLSVYAESRKVVNPASGWVAALRTSLNMTLEQLGQRMNISRQATSQIEKREGEGTVSLNVLRDVANALDMQLVYAIVPKTGTLEEYLEKRAKEMAKELYLKANQQMRLEDQAVEDKKVQQAIDDAAIEYFRKVDRQLWD